MTIIVVIISNQIFQSEKKYFFFSVFLKTPYKKATFAILKEHCLICQMLKPIDVFHLVSKKSPWAVQYFWELGHKILSKWVKHKSN